MFFRVWTAFKNFVYIIVFGTLGMFENFAYIIVFWVWTLFENFAYIIGFEGMHCVPIFLLTEVNLCKQNVQVIANMGFGGACIGFVVPKWNCASMQQVLVLQWNKYCQFTSTHEKKIARDNESRVIILLFTCTISPASILICCRNPRYSTWKPKHKQA